MRVQRVRIERFRGVREGTVHLDGNTLLVGGTGVGKSTLCEALDLVLGPERVLRRPVVDEHDFHESRYLPSGDEPPPQIRIEVVLTDLPDPALRRFRDRLRLWSSAGRDFTEPPVPEMSLFGASGTSDAGTTPTPASGVSHQGDSGQDDKEEIARKQMQWSLPVVFLGRFDPEEDDFVGDTFFDHPVPDPEQSDPGELGEGRRPFRRADKRLCGFLYLRANRTGARALSFQRGSLLDTIIRLEAEQTGLIWEQALRAVDSVKVSGRSAGDADETASAPGALDASEQATAEASPPLGFAPVRTAVRDRIARFVSLGHGPDALEVQVSELTRENLREVLRLVVCTQPGTHGVPISRLSTGTLNQLVFALLTYIAELQGQQSVIFAMEEPEIALPPHAQRRLVDFVTTTMGQVIVTSHSPYVIGRFDPHQIVPLNRGDDGILHGSAIHFPTGFKSKRYHHHVHQFAEAVLARAVLVVEGATELVVFRAVADVLEADPFVGYEHPDLAGLSLFDAGNDVSVPEFAAVFLAMNKTVFAVHDTPNQPMTPDPATIAALASYTVIPYLGIEDLLVSEVPVLVQRRFALAVTERVDYPSKCGTLPETAADDAVRAHVRELLRATKGSGSYGALLVAECSGTVELPPTISSVMLGVHTHLAASTGTPPYQTPGSAPRESQSGEGPGTATDGA